MANFNFNKVIIGGRLTSKPELKTTPNGKMVTTFSVAVNRKGDGADFLNVTAWEKTADHISRYYDKGSSICIVGRLAVRTWEENGKKRYATDIIAEETYFVDGKNDGKNDTPANNDTPVYMPDSYKMDNVTDDEDLPF